MNQPYRPIEPSEIPLCGVRRSDRVQDRLVRAYVYKIPSEQGSRWRSFAMDI
jgi:hypothetical protein